MDEVFYSVSRQTEPIVTERLLIRPLAPGDVDALHANSLDEDVRRFVPDEVFDTPEKARRTLDWLMAAEQTDEGPYVWAVLLPSGENIGYVQVCPIPEGWEAGYHIAKPHTGKGYATEALRAFMPMMMKRLRAKELYGVALEQNAASHRVLEKCGFALAYRGEAPYQGERRALRRYVYRADDASITRVKNAPTSAQASRLSGSSSSEP